MPKPYVFRDYYRLSFTEQLSDEYIIGTNFGDEFISEEMTVCTSEDCWLFINDDGKASRIYKDTFFDFHSKIYKVKTKRVNINGFLDIWSEGSVQRD